MHNFLLERQILDERLKKLTEFIESNPDARELKRAIAVKLILQGEKYKKVSKLLGMSESRISYWRKRFEELGLEGIKLGYEGQKSYLSDEERAEVIKWLQSREYFTLDELINYIIAVSD